MPSTYILGWRQISRENQRGELVSLHVPLDRAGVNAERALVCRVEDDARGRVEKDVLGGGAPPMVRVMEVRMKTLNVPPVEDAVVDWRVTLESLWLYW